MRRRHQQHTVQPFPAVAHCTVLLTQEQWQQKPWGSIRLGVTFTGGMG